MLLVLLAACEPQVDAPEGKVEPPPADVRIDLLPSPLDFGEVGIGEYGVKTLAIQNAGEATVQLIAVGNPSEDLSLLAPTYVPLARGGSEDVTLMWFPHNADGLNTTLQLLFTNEDGLFWEMPLVVSGVAGGPAIVAPTEGVSFGTVSVGCEGTESLTLTNGGTGDLLIENVRLSGQREFTATGPDGEFAPFPWLLAAGESREVLVRFAPSDESPASSVIEITSNDPLNGLLEVPLSGTGRIDARNSITFEVGERQYITALFTMNEVAASNGQFGRLMEGALPTLFELLQAEGRRYRIGFIVHTQGEVEGGLPYIDETMSVTEAMNAFAAMTSGASGDLDTQLATLGQGIIVNRSWLLDESAEWADSRLSLIGINSDTEQSSGNSTSYLNQFRAYKNDPSDIVVHAIGGDVPRGCNGGAGAAEPFEMFYLAAQDSGGTFLSICDPDWVAHMEKLALGLMGEASGFQLTGNPAAATVHVFIDGFEETEGWEYNPTTKMVTFDSTHYPSEGSTLRIDYLMASECPE